MLKLLIRRISHLLQDDSALYKTHKAWLSVRDLAVVYMRRILGIRNEGVVGALNKVGVRS
ncbi:hypothetical protein F9C07_3991 [Aspergillus flavus]|uniref:Uncharacterized protein n=1 Tax=Aspergillus flavus (strain ATCC 200026 / FGSC A1120 / IAM 13836 / NRRL 3357 / JCM 12722 / SRRC 167) TaxID=332952 RepID=A0A7U2MUS2_ASPFN|nr:hypothetical protein F9C07_3991 [Aspergillus flavus]